MVRMGGSILIVMILLVVICMVFCMFLFWLEVVCSKVVLVVLSDFVNGCSDSVVFVGLSFCCVWMKSDMFSVCLSVLICCFIVGCVSFSVWVVFDNEFFCIMVRKV